MSSQKGLTRWLHPEVSSEQVQKGRRKETNLQPLRYRGADCSPVLRVRGLAVGELSPTLSSIPCPALVAAALARALAPV
ncbi:hypothetical protein J6590_058568 [Homalodisca vitripennis]|nr:hypothetical protein J6590_058568 [Homalodisca vitripennis]